MRVPEGSIRWHLWNNTWPPPVSQTTSEEVHAVVVVCAQGILYVLPLAACDDYLSQIMSSTFL